MQQDLWALEHVKSQEDNESVVLLFIFVVSPIHFHCAVSPWRCLLVPSCLLRAGDIKALRRSLSWWVRANILSAFSWYVTPYDMVHVEFSMLFITACSPLKKLLNLLLCTWRKIVQQKSLSLWWIKIAQEGATFEAGHEVLMFPLYIPTFKVWLLFLCMKLGI